MPRKRPLTRTNPCKVLKSSHTEDEIRSPYFVHTEGVSEATTQGEKSEEREPHSVPDPLTSQPAPARPHGAGQRLTEDFYDQECVALAKALLGKAYLR